MFGYLRPNISELKLKDYQMYKTHYCSLCHAIEKELGQFSRFFLSYDLTMLVICLMAFDLRPISFSDRHCYYKIGKENACIDLPQPVFSYVAILSFLLADAKNEDNLRDGEHKIRSQVLKLFFSSKKKKVLKTSYLEEANLIQKSMERISEIEKQTGLSENEMFRCLETYQLPEVANVFGDLFKNLLTLAPIEVSSEVIKTHALPLVFEQIARWIYLIDAISDLEEDKKKQRYNPFLACDDTERLKFLVNKVLEKMEEQIDAMMAVLPFERNAEIIENLILEGMPLVRLAVLQGQPLPLV